MYCKQCGKQMDSAVKYCKYCGASQVLSNSSHQPETEPESNDNNATPSESELSYEEQQNIIRNHNIFFNDDETLIDTLGSGFLSSFFVQKTFSKSILICSTRRLYQKGKMFTKTQGGISYLLGEQSTDLRDITGIMYYIENPIYRLYRVMFLLIIALIAVIFGEELGNEFEQPLKILAGIAIGFAITLSILYSLKKRKWLKIEHAGGSIMTPCFWYPQKDIRLFMKNVSVQRDKIFDDNQSNFSNKLPFREQSHITRDKTL
jgi:hypothetical protein